MAGLHQCPHCGYKFETAEDLKRHLESNGCPEAHHARS